MCVAGAGGGPHKGEVLIGAEAERLLVTMDSNKLNPSSCYTEEFGAMGVVGGELIRRSPPHTHTDVPLGYSLFSLLSKGSFYSIKPGKSLLAFVIQIEDKHQSDSIR